MKITCKEYNKRWKEKKLGYVIRYLFGEFVVCDGYAPDSDTEIEESAVFTGYVVKSYKTYEEAKQLRNILNA